MLNIAKPFLVILFLIFNYKTALGDELNDLINRVSNLDVTAIERVEKLSKDNNEFASFLLSQIYYDGILAEKDEELSLFYLSRIKIDKKLLGEKFVLMAMWETDKDIYDHQYVTSLLNKAVELNSKSAVINLAQELILDHAKLERAMALFYSAINEFGENRIYRQYAAILYLYAGLKKAGKRKNNVLDFASKPEFNEALRLLENSSHPFKYFILWQLMNYEVIKKDYHLRKIYMLLIKDLSYLGNAVDVKGPKIDIDLRKRALEYLNRRYKHLIKIAPEIYNHCNQIDLTEHNKCLRLVDVITGICQWPDTLEMNAAKFGLSRYARKCRENNFEQFKQNIEDWNHGR